MLLQQWPVLTTISRPDTQSRTYHYENADFPYALTGITDERVIRYATFGYDASGRVVSSGHAAGADLFTFSYDDVAGTVVATNPLFKQTIYDCTDTAQGTRLLTAIVGEAPANCPMSNSTFEYDANDFPSAAMDGEGRRTERTNDARGLPTLVERAVGTADEQSTSHTWHATAAARWRRMPMRMP